MKITKVKYEKLFPAGAFLNEKIGLEAEIDYAYNMDSQRTEAMETPESAIAQLRQIAENIHKEKYPHFYNEQGQPQFSESSYQQAFQGTVIQPVVEESSVPRSREDIIKAHLITINECKTLRNLEMFAPMVKRENVDVLYEAYNNKKKELQ